MDAASWLRNLQDSNTQVEKRQRQQDLTKFLEECKSLEDVMTDGAARIADFFSAERCLLWAADGAANQLWSRAKAASGEAKDLRLPLDASNVASFVVLSKATVNLRNVSDPLELARVHPKLKYDDRADVALGYKTKALLAGPIIAEPAILGVLELQNRKDGLGAFFPRDLAAVEEVTRAVANVIVALQKAREARASRKAGKWDGLLDANLVTIDGLQKALSQASSAGVDPAKYLIEKAGIAREAVERSLAAFYGCEPYRFSGRETIPPDLRARLRQDYLKKLCAVPLERRGNQLVVVIDDPSDLGRTDALRTLDTAMELVLQVGLRDEILSFLENAFPKTPSGGPAGDVTSILRELSGEEAANASVEDAADDEGKVGESDSAVIKLANQIIIDAFRRGASDIHIEPNGKDQPVSVRFRVDGDCIQYSDVPSAVRSALVARIKIMAKLDISERRKPQDGKIKFKLPDRQIELRVATLPTVNGNEDVVMRILAASKPMPLAEMGLSERNYTELRKVVTKPYGLVLVVGPTGSGKTTTLHSALGSINTPDMKIWTAEDPVEITQPGLRQVQVQAKIGFDFATAMRAFLRADPDVIMVGEMRDKETASMGVEASLTGHLVFSTLHTNSAPETITRLIDMGLDPFSFADALLGVLAQRLARAICPRCKQEYVATPDEFATISEAFGEEDVVKRGWKLGELKLWRGAGCDTCGKSGYKGRLGIHELLVNNDEIKHAIARRAPVEEIRQHSIAGGMTTLLQDGILKSIAGRTDLKQVLAVCAK